MAVALAFARVALGDEGWRSFRALASVSGLTAARALGVLIERSGVPWKMMHRRRPGGPEDTLPLHRRTSTTVRFVIITSSST